MASEYKLVQTIEQLADSAIEFNSKPEFWKAALGSGPKYFVHLVINGAHAFGLSKFCAFLNISVEDYLAKYRGKTGGTKTQKHICSLTGQDWTPRNEIENQVRERFDNWILDFFPNYQLDNASFITLDTPTKRKNKKRRISLKTLLETLRIQQEIGSVGEEIALLFEMERLQKKGIENPINCIDQVSKRNCAAGYDIFSSGRGETRYIEVKSSLQKSSEFFITQNEIETLQTLGSDAYLYLVHVIDLESKSGNIIETFQNPIDILRRTGTIKPVLYKAEIMKKETRATKPG